jgi:flagellar biosynthesis GTPase FlhF
MSDAKKPTGKSMEDVKQPGKSAAGPTSKPVIVNNRPILQDPMMVETVAQSNVEEDKPSGTSPAVDKPKVQPVAAAPELATSKDSSGDTLADAADAGKKPAKTEIAGEKVIAPLASAPESASSEEKSETEVGKEANTTKAPEPEESKPDDGEAAEEQDKSNEKKADSAEAVEDVEAEAKAEAEHDAAIEKMIDEKKHFLPINSVEKRKTKRFILLGVLLSIVLAAAWVDIALDAGLIQLDNVKPVTHFFSN